MRARRQSPDDPQRASIAGPVARGARPGADQLPGEYRDRPAAQGPLRPGGRRRRGPPAGAGGGLPLGQPGVRGPEAPPGAGGHDRRRVGQSPPLGRAHGRGVLGLLRLAAAGRDARADRGLAPAIARRLRLPARRRPLPAVRRLLRGPRQRRHWRPDQQLRHGADDGAGAGRPDHRQPRGPQADAAAGGDPDGGHAPQPGDRRRRRRPALDRRGPRHPDRPDDQPGTVPPSHPARRAGVRGPGGQLRRTGNDPLVRVEQLGVRGLHRDRHRGGGHPPAGGGRHGSGDAEGPLRRPPGDARDDLDGRGGRPRQRGGRGGGLPGHPGGDDARRRVRLRPDALAPVQLADGERGGDVRGRAVGWRSWWPRDAKRWTGSASS